jgi:hypothetical protein
MSRIPRIQARQQIVCSANGYISRGVSPDSRTLFFLCKTLKLKSSVRDPFELSIREVVMAALVESKRWLEYYGRDNDNAAENECEG